LAVEAFPSAFFLGSYKMKKIKFLFIIFLLTTYNLPFAASRSFAQETSKETEALFVAKKAFEDGFYEVSLSLLERFLKNYPHSARVNEVNLLIGQCYFYQDKFLEALKILEGLLANPRIGNLKDAVLYWIAEVHFRGNSFDLATKYYQAVINEYPNSSYVPSAYYSLGWCVFQQGEFRKALEYFKIVEEKFPQEPSAGDASFKIIECLYNLKEYKTLQERIKPYLKIYAKDPAKLSYLYFYNAEAEYYLNNFTRAIDWYEKALAQSADAKINALSQLGVGWSYLKLKRYKQAQDVFSGIKTDDLEKKSADILLLGTAILNFETKKFNQAKKTYDELLGLSSDPLVLFQAYLGKGDCLYAQAEYKQAIAVYEEVLSRFSAENIPPDISDKLHYGLAWAFLKEGEFKPAIEEFQKIARQTEDKIVKVSALCQIGDAYQDSGEYLKAQETYDNILKDYPDSFYGDYVQYQLGITLLKLSNYEGAILAFKALKKNFPDSKLTDDAYYALGLAYFQRQDYNASKETFEKFADDFKDSALRPQAMYLLGTSLYNLAKYSEAAAAFRDVIRFYGHDTQLAQKAEYEIADCYYQMGNEKEAIERFKALRARYPDSSLSAEVVWWLGEFYYRQKNLELAQRYFFSIIKDFPNSSLVADAYYVLGSIYTEEAKYEEAIDHFKTAMQTGKSDLTGQAAIAVADIYLKQDKFDAALKTYQQVLGDYPNLSGLIYPKIADLHFRLNDYSQALDYYNKSLNLVSIREVSRIQFNIAEVLETQGEIPESIENYLKVTYLYAEDQDLAVKALLRVAQIYEDRENFKEALSIYKRIDSMDTEEAKYARERMDWIKANMKY
jgi:tetratricopeptide (TPR) repeat protein